MTRFRREKLIAATRELSISLIEPSGRRKSSTLSMMGRLAGIEAL